VDSTGSERAAATGCLSRAERVLLWIAPVLFACAAWAAFHEYGWLGWLAALPGAYVGRAAGDLALSTSHRVETTGEPRGIGVGIPEVACAPRGRR
jgi:hypothetical protein